MSSDEAEILSVVELEHNMNEATTNALGLTERSSHKGNKVAGATMGALAVRCLSTGVEFHIGTGFSARDREWFWNNKDNVAGKIVTYNHFAVGRKDLPRFPSYKGFRSVEDM
jgi:DNA ligase-1